MTAKGNHKENISFCCRQSKGPQEEEERRGMGDRGPRA